MKKKATNFGNIYDIYHKRGSKREKCKCGRIILGKFTVCDFCAEIARRKDASLSRASQSEELSDWGH